MSTIDLRIQETSEVFQIVEKIEAFKKGTKILMNWDRLRKSLLLQHFNIDMTLAPRQN